jgi:hypothetical protein
MAILPSGLRMDVLRRDVIPVLSAYVVFLAILIGYRREFRREARGAIRAGRRARSVHRTRPEPRWSDLARYLASLMAGGYLFFLAIVVVFYFVLGGEDAAFIRQALVDGSMLTFAIVLPLFVLLAWMDDVRSARRSRGGTGRTDPGS